MSISLSRVKAIFVKDYREFSRNYGISIVVVVPILFALLFRSAGPSLPGAIGFLLNISFILLTSMTQACLIAEEKERNTLRSLMMTPATTTDVLIGKSSLVFTMTAIVLAIAIYILGYEPASMWAFVVAIIFSIILYIAVGTICGLFTKTVLEASLSIIPASIIFTAPPVATLLFGDFPIFKVLDYTPSIQLVNLLNLPHIGFTTGDLIKPLLIILAWTVVLSFVSVVLYQRRLKDE